MMSNRRGAGNDQAANEYYTVATVMSFICAMALLISYSLFTEPLLVLFGADGNVLKLGVDYMQAMCFSVPTFTMCACLATFMRNDGEAIIPTVATIIGGVINIILDILLVFTFDPIVPIELLIVFTHKMLGKVKHSNFLDHILIYSKR